MNAALPPLLHAHGTDFPDIATAQRERDGLVALGGDLSPQRLLAAYRQGIFPWYDDAHPIMWWAFAERMALKTERLHCGRSLQKRLRNHPYRVTVNCAFDTVIRHCAQTARPNQNGTWLTQQMQQAYRTLHQLGYAHSFEYWYPHPQTGDWRLGGGLYGVLIGRIFYGESMFTHVNDASKIAFVQAVGYLQRLGVPLIDCQVYTDHLARFGAAPISFAEFHTYLQHYCPLPPAEAVTTGIIALSPALGEMALSQ